MAGADISLKYDDCTDDTDEGFDQGDCLTPETQPSWQVPLPPLLKVQKYAQSTESSERNFVPNVILDLFRNAPVDELTRDLPEIMKVFIKLIEAEPVVRDCLLDRIPDIAAQAEKSSERVGALKDVVGDYLIPLVVRNLGCTDTAVDRAAQNSLLQLIDRGYVSKFQAEVKICPSILALSKMESQLHSNAGAVAVMSNLAALLGRDITERIFLKRFTDLCTSHMFHVRKIAASHFGHFCAVIGNDSFEKNLLPCYLSLCTDEIWGVRKSCAEVIMFMSSACPPELRKSLLAPAFEKLLQDECRWVRMSAYQILGAFISTFASPPLTSIGYNSLGKLALLNASGGEFEPGDLEEFIKPPIRSAADEILHFDLFYSDRTLMYPSNVSKNSPPSHIKEFELLCGDQDLQNPTNDEENIKFNETTPESDAQSAPNLPISSSKTDSSVINTLSMFKRERAYQVDLSKGQLNTTAEKSSTAENKDIEKVNNLHAIDGEFLRSQHEDDLLFYNEFNYWHISPEENITLDDNLIGSGDDVKLEDSAISSSFYVMSSRLEDLYAKVFKSMGLQNEGSDELVKKSDGDDNTAIQNTVAVLVEPPQKIVPHNLIESFVSMANCEHYPNDNDMSFHCAYALPAVVLTLGKDNWPLLKNTVDVLAGHRSYKIRRTIASSLHEIAHILGPEMATEHLAPLFEGFLKDLDEVRIGILRHLAAFLQLINPEKRATYLPKLGEFLRVDNVCNWRFQDSLAEQLKEVLGLFKPTEIVKHIGLYAQALMTSNVAAVRQSAILLVTEIIKNVTSERGLASNYLIVIAERFAHSKKWKPRQTFALLCTELRQQGALPSEEFASVVLPHLLDLSWDPVANVRLVVTRCLVKNIIDDDYFSNPSSEHYETLQNVLRRLQTDKDRDVRNQMLLEPNFFKFSYLNPYPL